MGGKMSRRKGANFEREIANFFKPIFGNDCRRGFQYRSGEEAPDVEMPAFWVECKREKRTYPKKALQQAIDGNTEGNRMPLAICKDDKEPIIVTMLFDDFLEVVEGWWKWENI